ncbi:hypothetical protein TrCOL_g2239 [Triparma columacea]|uniref:Uncharacterized protein n=1 Tax=Triparma columacea TaxID=722753 RepID=A0A9W7G2V7_9STRA|nr:hypothetical protein TrCOL_g2239 [Triparma columacea]
MSRSYDYGKDDYGGNHRSYPGQNTRHILAVELLGSYGCNSVNYEEVADFNYRMGSKDTNTRDQLIDNRIIAQNFSDSRYPNLSYTASDAADLANNPEHTYNVSYQQQINALHQRFMAAMNAYQQTGEYKYFMIMKDIREIAGNALNCDLREFRLPQRG